MYHVKLWHLLDGVPDDIGLKAVDWIEYFLENIADDIFEYIHTYILYYFLNIFLFNTQN